MDLTKNGTRAAFKDTSSLVNSHWAEMQQATLQEYFNLTLLYVSYMRPAKVLTICPVLIPGEPIVTIQICPQHNQMHCPKTKAHNSVYIILHSQISLYHN